MLLKIMNKLKDFLFSSLIFFGSLIFFLYISYLFLSGNLFNLFINNNITQFFFSLEIQFINNIYNEFNDNNYFIGLIILLIFIIANIIGIIFLFFNFIIFLGCLTLWIGFIFPEFYRHKILGPLNDF
tara:strand:- start:194 stop:574 length:381 start_codon:yes stop_codon:yes gene_type:complete